MAVSTDLARLSVRAKQAEDRLARARERIDTRKAQHTADRAESDAEDAVLAHSPSSDGC
jgi:hypothetical protein